MLSNNIQSLAPIHQWFFSQEFQMPYHFNQGIILKKQSFINTEKVKIAIKMLIQHHDSLRIRFVHTSSGITQHTEPFQDKDVVQELNLSNVPITQQQKYVNKQIKTLQKKINFKTGPILVALIIKGFHNHNHNYLLLLAHHIVTDILSWYIIAEDFTTLYNCDTLLTKPINFIYWAQSLISYVEKNTCTLSKHRNYWDNIISEMSAVKLPFYQSTDKMFSYNMKEHVLVINNDILIQKLLSAANIFELQLREMLIIIVVLAIKDFTQQQTVTLELETRSRNEIKDYDFSKSIGWFTHIYPVIFKVNDKASLKQQIYSIKNTLENIPQNGFTFPLLRYYQNCYSFYPKKDSIAPIRFNYVGYIPQKIKEWEFSAGLPTSISMHLLMNKKNHWPGTLDISIAIINSKLLCTFYYSMEHYKTNNIMLLAERFENYFKEISQETNTII